MLVSLANNMDSEEKPRSIRFPQWLWDEIDRDAQRCKRSAVKQMEVVLTAYYRDDATGLDMERLTELRPRAEVSKVKKDVILTNSRP